VKPDALHANYVDAATLMNASIAAQLLLAKPMRPGVFAPEKYFDVASYLPGLAKRNFAARTLVQTTFWEIGIGCIPYRELVMRPLKLEGGMKQEGFLPRLVWVYQNQSRNVKFRRNRA
jgi:hypothetical protein